MLLRLKRCNLQLLEWLNHYGIREKLLIFISIPLVSILFFAITGITEKYQQYINSKNTHSFLSLVITIDDLVYELQKERGISAIRAATDSSKQINDISLQRTKTDNALHSYFQHKKTANIEVLSPVLRQESLDLDYRLKQLPKTRAAIDAKDLENLIQSYSDLNSYAINFVQHLQLLTKDSDLALLIDAYTNLLWLKERAGQERATLMLAFVSGQMDADSFRRVVAYVASQESVLKSYNIKAPYEYRKLLEEKLQDPVNKEVIKYRDAAVNKVLRNELLNELQSLIGYGGIIHDFKNYVIRGGVHYREKFLNRQQQVHSLIKRYKSLPGMTEQDLAQLGMVEKTFNKYFRLVDKVTLLRQQGATAEEIDKAVKVDDMLALQAIAYLRKDFIELDASVWWKNSTKRIDLVNEATKRLRLELSQLAAKNIQSEKRALLVYLLVTLITAAFSLIVGMFLMLRLIVELKNISQKMKNMLQENRFDRPLPVSGKDEIAVMANTFNQLICERMKFETELQRSAAVFENVTEAIMIADIHKRIQMVNPAFTSVSGYIEEDILNKDFLCLSGDLVDQATINQMWDKLSNDSHWEGEIWHRKPNGEKYLTWMNISVVINAQEVITQFICMFTDITQRKQYEENIWRQANYDSLTNLPNRNMFMNRLSHHLKIAARMNTQTAVLFVDLDRFKDINDTLGHSAGDELLVEIANRLKHCVRKSDTVSRLGGDEFVIILNNVKKSSDINVFSKNVLMELSKPVYLSNGIETFTSGSIGIALFPYDGTDVETLMRQADAAMYQSKKAGRNNFTFYTAEMNYVVNSS